MYKRQEEEYPILSDFLYEAIFIPESMEKPPKAIIEPVSYTHLDVYKRQNASRLFRDSGIRYQNSRTHDGRKVSLWKETDGAA